MTHARTVSGASSVDSFDAPPSTSSASSSQETGGTKRKGFSQRLRRFLQGTPGPEDGLSSLPKPAADGKAESPRLGSPVRSTAMAAAIAAVAADGPEAFADYTEPAPRYLHCRLHEASLPAGLRDASEGVFVKAALGRMKIRTTVKAKTLRPKWNHEMVFVCLKPEPDHPCMGDEEETLDIVVKQFFLVKSNAVVFQLAIPLATVPTVDTSVEAPPEPRWFFASSPASGSARRRSSVTEHENAVRAAVWFEAAYDTREAAPVIGKVSVALQTATFPAAGRFQRHRSVYAVFQHGRRWIKLPAMDSHSYNLHRDPIVFDVTEPASILTVAMFDTNTNASLGVVRVRVSVLPPNEWYTTPQPLYVRKENRRSIASTLKQAGHLVLRLRWCPNPVRELWPAYLKPLQPPRFQTPTFQKYHSVLVRNHNDLVVAHLKRHHVALPKAAARALLHTRLDVFSFAECRVQLNRFIDAWDCVEWAAAGLSDLGGWKTPLASLAANAGWVALVYRPLATCQLLLGLLAVALWRNSGQREAVLATCVGMDLRLFERDDDDAKKEKAAATNPHTDSPKDADRATAEAEDEEEAEEEDAEEPEEAAVAGVPKAKLSKNPAVILQDKLAAFFIGGLKVQHTFARMATWVERCTAVWGWHDPTISSMALALTVALFLWLALLPFTVRPVLTFAGLYLLRHPRFRDEIPPPPLSCLRRLPNRNDRVVPSSEDYSDRSFAGL